jgi:hypothetical protein
MELEEFCRRLAQVPDLKVADKALALMWWHDDNESGVEVSPTSLARLMRDAGLANSSPTFVKGVLQKTGHVLKGSNGYRLKTASRRAVRASLGDIVDPELLQVPAGPDYLPAALWAGGRGYIVRVCLQLNGSYSCGFYDCAAVMLRRLVETLIIEAFEKLGRAAEIRDVDGNYRMLSGLTQAVLDPSGLQLTRDSRRALHDIKSLGDRSAHSRKYNAVKGDLEKVELGVRVLVEDLLHIAGLHPASPPQN